MNIIIDLAIIAEAYKKSNQTGIFRYAEELFNNLRNSNSLNLSIAVVGIGERAFTTDSFLAYTNEHKITVQLANDKSRKKFLPFRKEKPMRYLYNKFQVSQYRLNINEQVFRKNEIYHSPFYPIGKEIKKFAHQKFVLTVHDLIPILYPELNHDTKLLQEALNSIAKDGFVICVSENTRKDLLNYMHQIPPERVFVSHLAASPDIFYRCNDIKKFEEVRKEYNIPRKYFLALSTIEPRKNIDHLIRCFVKFISRYHISDLSLILVGSKGWLYDGIFKEYENVGEVKDKIIFTGRIPDDYLATVYSNANSFYYMSLYEGFGLPPLEAMQCGVPTVTSNTSSLPEVVGDGGIMIDPKDEESLIATMYKLYNDQAYNQLYSEKALAQAGKFSWKITAEKHIEIYKEILQMT